MKHQTIACKMEIVLLVILPVFLWNGRAAFGQDTLRWTVVARQVLKNTPAVEKARAEKQSAAAMEKLHIGAYLPDLSLAFSSFRNEQGPREVFLGAQPFEQSGEAYSYHSAGLNFSYDLFDWGNRHRKSQSLDDQYHSKQWALVQAERDALQEAFSTYCDLLGAKESLQLVNEEQTMLQRQHTLVSRLAERGLQPSVDLRRVEVEQRDLQSEIYQQQGNLEGYRQTLASMMSGDIPKSIYFAPVSIPEDSIAFEKEKVAAIIGSHPDIRARMAALHSAQAEVRIIHWEQFPDLTLGATYQRGNTRFAEVYGSLPQNWNTVLSLQLSLPLFDHNNRRTEQERQRLQVQTVSADLRNRRRQLRLQFQKLLDDYNVQIHNYHLQQQNVADYRVIYQYEQQAYQAGSGEYRDYLAALRSYLTTRQTAVQTKYQLAKTHFQIELFLGRWDSPEEK